jgi:hypothetical protein
MGRVALPDRIQLALFIWALILPEAIWREHFK